jgi:hypothetical protein
VYRIPKRIKGWIGTMKKIVLIALVAALFTRTLSGIELPKAPAGFTWQEVPELKAAFLRFLPLYS